ncbi:MAG TPA: NAD(P)-dependent methylenetetrahydromethanopterin dehydrogenase [Stellaceae bacterium]|nr:NAD(P)-dependent methylenetetrahydromethanopterin dehydrogenase [Stellaceae bacterium]
MDKPRILHFLTPLANLSPFDVNMAYDAGFVVAGYTNVDPKETVALTQDAMFSRAPQDAAKTVLFIGGRDAMVALDMAEAARKAMFPPFQNSIFADPSGAFTTAAAMVALAEKHLVAQGGRLAGAKVAVFGAKGVVGGVTGIIAAEAGAQGTLVGHDHTDAVPQKAAAFERRFGKHFIAADGSSDEGRRKVLADCDVVLVAAKAGIQVLSRQDLEAASNLKVAADVNAVPPAGIEGLATEANGTALGIGKDAVGIGALAIGDIKFRLQHQLLQRLHDSEKAMYIDFRDAYREAREMVGLG